MQQQQRTQVSFSAASKKANRARTQPQGTHAAPIVLDLDALKKVVGGTTTTEAPRKFW